MNYGLYLSATGTLSAMHKQDVVANNLANVQTVGFKPDLVDLMDRLPQRLERPHLNISPHEVLERLGGGHFVAPSRTDFRQGELVRSGNDLDLAIRGEGFFVVGGARGEGNERPRFTRDGRFALNARNELVLATNGLNVFDVQNRSIRLDPGTPVRIDAEGNMKQNGRIVARIQVAEVPDLQSLRKSGDNLFTLDVGSRDALRPATARLEQGYTEASAVDPILTLNEMINATKAAQSNARMIQFHDSLLDQVMNRFARVA